MDNSLHQIQQKESWQKLSVMYEDNITENQLRDYLSSRQIEEHKEDNETANKIRQRMLIDTKSAQDLKDDFPDLYEQAQQKEANLKIDANRSGKDKLSNDLLGKKKRAAKKELKKIQEERKRLKLVKEENPVYLARKKKSVETGKKPGMFSDMVLSSFFDEERKEMGSPLTEYLGNSLQLESNKVDIKTDGGNLKGMKYSPKMKINPPKFVILFGGSDVPVDASMALNEAAKKYVESGATVYMVDYRDFGQSTIAKGERLCENSLYEDGNSIYDYVKKSEKCDASNIILHGYSLGGVVASKVAETISVDNAHKLHNKEDVAEEQRLGGLVLESPMKSMYYAAKSDTNALFGIAGKLLGGNFSAEDHLKRTMKYDPNLKVHFIGGDNSSVKGNEDGDFLSPQRTLIHKPYENMKNVTTHFESSEKTAINWQEYKTKAQLKEAKENHHLRSHVTNDTELANMVKYNRAKQ